MTQEKLENNPKNKSLEPPQTPETTGLEPKFSFSSGVLEKLFNKGLKPEECKKFVKNFDLYLECCAATPKLVGVSIFGVDTHKNPDRHLTDYYVLPGGLALNIITQWSYPREECVSVIDFSSKPNHVIEELDDQFFDISPLRGNSPKERKANREKLIAFLTFPVSVNDFPDLKALSENFSETNLLFIRDHTDSFGAVTTEQLRTEMAAVPGIGA